MEGYFVDGGFLWVRTGPNGEEHVVGEPEAAKAEQNRRDIAAAITQGRELLVPDEVAGEHLEHVPE